jgi:nucleotide-binding universal stress UspA family protein
MFKNVIVGVDGSPNGRDAIALASRLTDPDGRMTLVHVYSGLLRPSAAVTLRPAYEDADASIKLLERERADSGVDAEIASVVALSPGRGLHEQAERQRADLIVVGSCGRGLLGRVLVGDDARAALNGAPCATAIAARSFATQDGPFERIGVGYDETPESDAALAAAREIAAASGAGLHALQAVSLPIYAYSALMLGVAVGAEDPLEDANARLAALPGVDGRAARGYAGEELAIFSGSLDLLVVGSRSYGPVRRLVLGSTANHLERFARCSLLVLPRTAVTLAADHDTAQAQHTAA